MNKKQLYESIMRNVSKSVKKHLNENIDFDSVQGEYFKIDIYVDDDDIYNADITTEDPVTGDVITQNFSYGDLDDLAEEIGKYIIDFYF